MSETEERAGCAGRCKTDEAGREAQRRICHPERSGVAGTDGEPGDDLEWLRARVRRLNSEAGQLKMVLHDLAEGLPDGWERIVDVARRTAAKYAELAEARRLLQALEEKLGEG